MKTKTAFTLSGEPISWPYIWKLKRKRGLRAFDIDRIFFRAVHYKQWLQAEKGRGVKLIAIIEAGLKNGWIHITSPVEKHNKAYLESWIAENIYGKKREKKFQSVIIKEKIVPESIGDILKTL